MSDIPTRKERTTLGSVVRTPRPVHPGAAQLALDNSASWATEEGSRENVPRKLTPSDQKNSTQEKSRGAGFPPLTVTTGAEKAHAGSSPFPLCSRAGPRGEGVWSGTHFGMEKPSIPGPQPRDVPANYSESSGAHMQPSARPRGRCMTVAQLHGAGKHFRRPRPRWGVSGSAVSGRKYLGQAI